MSTASKGNPLFVDLQVGEIFTAAGTAFTKLGELTMQLHTSSVGGSTKWTEEDIQLMHECLTKFANEIDEITSRVKLRTISHMNAQIRKKEFEEAGLNPLPINPALLSSPNLPSHSGAIKRRTTKKLLGAASSSHHHLHHRHTPNLQPIGASITPPHTQDVTLNMLNASDGDVDLKMDFDSPPVSS